jgi:mRNA interferase RelE/StbE
MRWKIRVSPLAYKQLKDLPKGYRVKIESRIQALASEPFPSGVKKLSGLTQTYRIRQGPYRVIYRVRRQEGLVDVLSILPRKDAYRR